MPLWPSGSITPLLQSTLTSPDDADEMHSMLLELVEVLGPDEVEALPEMLPEFSSVDELAEVAEALIDAAEEKDFTTSEAMPVKSLDESAYRVAVVFPRSRAPVSRQADPCFVSP